MVLLDLLHVQRAGFFKFLKLGIDKELSQLNISVDKTRLQVIPFFDINTPPINAHSEQDVSHLLNLSQQSTTLREESKIQLVSEDKFSPKFVHESFNARQLPYLEKYGFPMLTTLRGEVPRPRAVRPKVVPVSVRNSHEEQEIQNTARSPEPFRGMLYRNGRSNLGSYINEATIYRSSLHILPLRYASQRLEKEAFKKKHGEIGNDDAKQALRFLHTTTKVVALHRKIQKTSKLFAEAKAFEKPFLNQNSYFRLIASKYSPREAILYHKSWSCKLVVKVLLTVDEKKTKNAQRSMPCRNSRTCAPTEGRRPKASKVGNQNPNQKRLCLPSERLRRPSVEVLRSASPEVVATCASTAQNATGGSRRPESRIPRSVARSEARSMIQGNEARFKQKKQSTKVHTILSDPEAKRHDAASFTSIITSRRPQAASTIVARHSKIQNKVYFRNIETFKKQQKSKQKNQKRDYELFLVLGELPLMTKRGHFIIHGSPRVILSQLIRTPGIYFTQKNHELQADCVPEQGPWLCIYKNICGPEELDALVPSAAKHPLEVVASRLTAQSATGSGIIDSTRSVPTEGSSLSKNFLPDISIEQNKNILMNQKLKALANKRSAVATRRFETLPQVSVEETTYDKDGKFSFKADQLTFSSDELSKKTKKQGSFTLQRREARPEVVVSKKQPTIEPSEMRSVALAVHKHTKRANQASYFCYTKQFSSMPFSLIYSTFRVFELHSQFTDQTLLLTKLKTLEKIRKFKEIITTLLTFTWKKRIRRRLQRLYTKRCFISTQQFEKTKVLFRLKKKLILGPLSRKSFNEKLNISSCINTGITETDFNDDFSVAAFADSVTSYPRIQTRFSAKEVGSLSSAKHGRWDALGSLEATWRGSAERCNTQDTKPRRLRGWRPSVEARPQVVPIEAFVVQGDERQDPSILTVGSIREAQEIQKGATFNSLAPTMAFGRLGAKGARCATTPVEAYYLRSGSPTGHNILPAKQRTLRRREATFDRPQVVVVDNYEPVSVEQNKIKETMWLSSATLLSQDLALIVRSLDGYKMLFQDDIDDLNNQRIRTSSDQIQQQIRVGLFRFKKMFVKLIASGNGSTSQTITDFLNGALREFFGSNPLSQFLDQTNPLAEITHKRRISKLGLGGVQRESATLKVRTIHFTYFGRICPIETPEGINAGLVNSLTCLSRVNAFGQLVTPLSPLIEGQKQEQFFYYSNQEKKAISTTDTALLKFQRLPNQFIYTKNESQFQQLQPNKVKLRVKSDLQTISLATALIPFLAYDDANRALMGSNMQRQAVPLILPERPIIRTGMESLVINESGHSIQSSCGGFVSYISAQYVVILCDTLNKRFLL